MKTFVKLTGIIPLIISILGFYMMVSSSAIVYMPKNVWEIGSDTYLDAQYVIFGGLGVGPTFAGLTSFILFILSFILLSAGIALPLIKIKDFSKLSSFLNFGAVITLILASILMFNIVPSYVAASGENSFCANVLESGYYTIGIYWIFSAIFSIFASLLSIIPAICDLRFK